MSKKRVKLTKNTGSDSPNVGSTYSNIPNYNQTNVIKDTEFQRIALLSENKFYDFDYLQVRYLKVKDLIKINQASQSQDFGLLVDALDATVDQDIRKLTVQDFFYLMYWHRINGYSDSPYTIKWTSFYGNDNKFLLDKSKVKRQEVLLEIAVEDIEKFHKLGITSPRIRDREIIEELQYKRDKEVNPDQQQKLDEQLWLAERAQYLLGDDFHQKLSTIENAELNLLENIKKFQNKSAHGVREIVEVTDNLFVAEVALKFLKEELHKVKAAISALDNDTLTVQGLKRLTELQQEINRIESALKEKKTVEARPEYINLSIGLDSFLKDV